MTLQDLGSPGGLVGGFAVVVSLGRGLFATDRGESLRAIVATRGFRAWWGRLGEARSRIDFTEYVASLPRRRESREGS